MARTQAERRDETRRRLIEAASALLARQGVGATSVDALAAEAERTSGAVYAHFGGKEGLVMALLDEWRDATAAVIDADFGAHDEVGERLASLWRNFVTPASDPDGTWVLLEHELWLYACRNPEAKPSVAARYESARRRLGRALQPEGGPGTGTLLIALLIGLEMQRRLDPTAVPDDLAVAGLQALLDPDRTAGREPADRTLPAPPEPVKGRIDDGDRDRGGVRRPSRGTGRAAAPTGVAAQRTR